MNMKVRGKTPMRERKVKMVNLFLEKGRVSKDAGRDGVGT